MPRRRIRWGGDHQISLLWGYVFLGLRHVLGRHGRSVSVAFANSLGGLMDSCPCSIFDVREEQILETGGSLCIRLICNVCGSVLDSKFVPGGEASARVANRDDEDLAIEASPS